MTSTNPVITLTTDFGLRDGFVGVMKGVIYGICPHAHIVDISHDVGPQDVREGAYVLARQAFYFPENTVHIAVVDPGVGTARRPLAARVGQHFYVAPDNGVLTPVYEKAGQEGWPLHVVQLNKPEYWLKNISYIFHGRDIFSPVGAHLACGVPLEEVGDPIDDPAYLRLPRPEFEGGIWQGEVTHIDHFGNIASNIHREHVGAGQVQAARVGGQRVADWVNAFGDRPPGTLVCLYSSIDFVIVSEVNGDAAARLGVKVGDAFEVEIA
ncbi:MAG: SAM-dependent chlorinase/fluorinase [Chloroflexi bacterium]|nr:SAM-dependent chlorinase/fluorinase [Chloroflexota bacterium]